MAGATSPASGCSTPPSLTATATISPESGGTLTPSAGFLTVNFPPGAVSSPTQLNFQLLATPQHPMRSYLFANRAFTLDAVAGGGTRKRAARGDVICRSCICVVKRNP